MAKFQVTFRVYPPEETSLHGEELYYESMSVLDAALSLANAFTDDNPDIKVFDIEKPYAQCRYFIKTAHHRGKELLILCDSLADYIAYKREGWNACAFVDEVVPSGGLERVDIYSD